MVRVMKRRRKRMVRVMKRKRRRRRI